MVDDIKVIRSLISKKSFINLTIALVIGDPNTSPGSMLYRYFLKYYWHLRSKVPTFGFVLDMVYMICRYVEAITFGIIKINE